MDRHAPRDRYDLWVMGERGLIDAGALEVFVRRGSARATACELGVRDRS